MRKLSGKDLFFMAMGSTIGAGIITNTGAAIGMAGSGVIIAYLMAFAVMFIANLPTMFFTTVHPVMSPQYVMTSWISKKVAGSTAKSSPPLRRHIWASPSARISPASSPASARVQRPASS